MPSDREAAPAPASSPCSGCETAESMGPAMTAHSALKNCTLYPRYVRPPYRTLHTPGGRWSRAELEMGMGTDKPIVGQQPNIKEFKAAVRAHGPVTLGDASATPRRCKRSS